MPRLAQPDNTVKLSSKAWTGCELLTGDKTHSLLGTGPAEEDTYALHLEKTAIHRLYLTNINNNNPFGHKTHGNTSGGFMFIIHKMKTFIFIALLSSLEYVNSFIHFPLKVQIENMNSKIESSLVFTREETKDKRGKKKAKKNPKGEQTKQR